MMRNKGFTLIEIIIALLVLGIGLVATMAYMPAGLDASRKAADINKAAMLARSIFAQSKAMSETNIANVDALDTAGAFIAADTSGAFIAIANYVGFEYKIDVNTKLLGQLRDVIVTVRWKFHGKLRTEIYKTQLVKYNPT